MFDLSVVITAHSEGRLLRPTLRSIAKASSKAISQGFTISAVLVLDNSDDATNHEAANWNELPGGIKLIKVRTNHGDAGSARNSGMLRTASKYVAFCDGDDLVSENYFLNGIERLQNLSEPTILHPNYVISFGASTNIWPIRSYEAKEISYQELLFANLWPSSSISQRDTYLKFPYKKCCLMKGLGPRTGFGISKLRPQEFDMNR